MKLIVGSTLIDDVLSLALRIIVGCESRAGKDGSGGGKCCVVCRTNGRLEDVESIVLGVFPTIILVK